MKQYILIILAVALFSAAVLQSCSEDKGNYDYIDLNDVEIHEVEQNYILEQMTVLKITPKLSFKLSEDESNLEYLWYILRTSINLRAFIGSYDLHLLFL